MLEKDKRVELDLSGANLKINDEVHKVTDGTLTVTVDHLYAPGDDPDNPTEKAISKDIKLESERVSR